ncbi:phosphomevalonate kinase [Microbacterium sp. SSW1-59]|uniref:phosphomevalonate kinase n=1 Tax=Microbacterium xanthum TaxID=3079794 RepID=UPI002AD2AB71|nr:phosphomevalonate kinase [Microbacterium sp. SSW1-59]MDZ8202425.1 phosphomevalonate kinase [Microbacterium sp. SSW1-59]
MTPTPNGSLVVRVPGKLFIAGEYAVVTPGEPAVLVAVDMGITVALDPVAPVRTVRSRGYRTLEWTPAETGIVPAHADHDLDYVVSALSVLERLRRERGIASRVFALDIDSGLDHGSGRKYGLGSSAAVTVGVVRAVGRHLGLDLTPTEEYRLSMLATLAVAPDASGGDVAASTMGGWILYRSPDRRRLLEESADAALSALLGSRAWDLGELTPLPAPDGLELVVGWTGHPASTRSLVSAVQSAVISGAVDHERFLDESRHAVSMLRDALCAAEGREAQDALRQARAVLRELGRQSGVEIETAALGRMCDIIEGRGGAAKPSGAGGGDCGVALVDADGDRASLEDDWRAHGIHPLPLAVWQREGDDRVG